MARSRRPIRERGNRSQTLPLLRRHSPSAGLPRIGEGCAARRSTPILSCEPRGSADAGLRVSGLGPNRNQKARITARCDAASNLQKLIDPFLKPSASSFHTRSCRKTRMVFIPTLCPTQFRVDLRCVEGLRLPHLEFVDCICWNVVAANQPGLLVIPGFRLLLGPMRGLRTNEGGLSNENAISTRTAVLFRGIGSPETECS